MTAVENDDTPPSLAGQPWLEAAETQAVFKAITGAGFSARIVGGAVRNALFGRPVKDVDFATTAHPDDVIRLAPAAGLAAVPTGVAHGTVTVVAGHTPFEVTTLREDVETFGRHARVAFTEDWAADARRRDFTINALYCDADGEVSDPLGGYPDLVARRIRFIGDAVERIREDYLRILRFFRFHAEYAHGALDAPGAEACTRERYGIQQLSGERLRAELIRLLAAPGAVSSVQAMDSHGILAVVLGEKVSTGTFVRLAEIEDALGRKPDAILRLAALSLPDLDPGRLKGRLRLSTSEAEVLHRLKKNSGSVSQASSDGQSKGLLYRLGRQTFTELVLFEWARAGHGPGEARWRAMLELAEQWPIPSMPLRGADLVARGVPAGRRIGEVLSQFERWWISEGFPSDPVRIEAELQRLLGNEDA